MKAIHPSDEDLRATILAAFAADARTASANLRVGVLNGVAHLAGATASLKVRETAEKLVKNVGGLRGVVNRIEAPGAPSPSRNIQLSPILKEKSTNHDEVPE